MIIIDASVLVDFLLGRSSTRDAVFHELDDDGQAPLHAPQLVEPEALNALRKLTRNGAISEQRGTEAVADLSDLRLIRYPHQPLRRRIWELHHQLSAYDAAYLALAEVLDTSILLTSDTGLRVRAEAVLGEDRVRYIS